MAFFNEFKEKFNKAAQSVTNKTKDGVEISRLAGESRNIANELATLYTQIGRCYVDARGESTAELEALCAHVEELRQKLEDVERQKLQLKNQNRCPACGAVTTANARFCYNCGRRMPEPPPEAEEAPAQGDAQYCPECGAMRKEEEKFCDVCGYNYAQEAQAEAAEEIVVQPVCAPDAEEEAEEAPSDFNAD